MKRTNAMKTERDRLVVECQTRNLKVRRDGRTVKQQIAVMNAALNPKSK